MIAELNHPMFSGRVEAKLTAILDKKKALEQETEVVNLLEQEVYSDLGGQESPSSPTSHLKEDIYINSNSHSLKKGPKLPG